MSRSVILVIPGAASDLGEKQDPEVYWFEFVVRLLFFFFEGRISTDLNFPSHESAMSAPRMGVK